MLIVMRHGATDDEVRRVCEVIQEMGYQARPMPGRQRTTVGLVGNDGRVDGSRIEALPGVQEVIHVSKPYKQVSREWKPESDHRGAARRTRHRRRRGRGHGRALLGGERAADRGRGRGGAGCRRHRAAGRRVQATKLSLLIPGTGVGRAEAVAAGQAETGLLIVTEAMDPEGADLVAEVADIIQIGARNMQNYSLLKRAGRLRKPVLLKRGLSATIQELLLSAEYILAEGNPNVILCERGVRGFDPATRNLFDLSAIPVVHGLSHLPIIADPSHGTGHREMVIPMARAAVAAGADGLLIEVHPNPDRALSDGAQSLYPEQFARLMKETRIIAEAIGRRVAVAGGVRV